MDTGSDLKAVIRYWYIHLTTTAAFLMLCKQIGNFVDLEVFKLFIALF